MALIRVTEMAVGDVGWLAGVDCHVQLRDGGRAGGCEHDLWLARIDDDDVSFEHNIPTVIVIDGDPVSV